MYYIYIDDEIVYKSKSRVAAELKKRELLRQGFDAHIDHDEGAR